METMDGKIILYEWAPGADFEPVTRFDDVAEGYRIVADSKANSGLVIYARYDGCWRPNPHSYRTLIRHFIEKMTQGYEKIDTGKI